MVDPEATIVRWEPWNGPPRRLVFEPAADGYYRREETWSDGRWIPVGTEVVEQPAIENAEALAVD